MLSSSVILSINFSIAKKIISFYLIFGLLIFQPILVCHHRYRRHRFGLCFFELILFLLLFFRKKNRIRLMNYSDDARVFSYFGIIKLVLEKKYPWTSRRKRRIKIDWKLKSEEKIKLISIAFLLLLFSFIFVWFLRYVGHFSLVTLHWSLFVDH